MIQFSKSKTLSWTHHARAKMNFYKLSEARVRRVLNFPKRIEEGVAPKTVAMMQPSSFGVAPKELGRSAFATPKLARAKAGFIKLRRDGEKSWTQEIWVMVEDSRDRRTIISAWRYPGKTKPRSEISLAKMREEYQSFMERRGENGDVKA
jgi:hypothetical protein